MTKGHNLPMNDNNNILNDKRPFTLYEQSWYIAALLKMQNKEDIMVCFKNVRKKLKITTKNFFTLKRNMVIQMLAVDFPDQFGNNILIFKTCNAHTTSIKYIIC